MRRPPWRRSGIRAAALLAAAALPLAPAAARAQEAGAGARETAAGARASADSSFRAFLPEFEAATRALLGGDPDPWLGLLSAAPGGTLFTPFGGVVAGRPALDERYRAVAAGFAPGPARLDVEYLAVEVSGDQASVVALERTAFRRAGANAVETGYTRATMVFRREDGRWRLRHRHMDHLGAPGE